jgi:hypothetical protein
MPRSNMAVLLAAVTAAMSILAGQAHGGLECFEIASTAAAAGLAAYLALPIKKGVSKYLGSAVK